MAEGKGIIYRISGPVVTADGLKDPKMYDVVRVGEEGLIGEIIKLVGGKAIIQVYENTGGLKPGDPVASTGAELSVTLGPGLIGSIFDGIQRPLDKIKEKSGDFIAKGRQCRCHRHEEEMEVYAYSKERRQGQGWGYNRGD